MRKNTARHWLHAGLDLLPLILIPVFMIYSHRHTIDSGSIEVPVNRVVDFNQIVNYDSISDSRESGGITCVKNDDGSFVLNGTAESNVTFSMSIGYYDSTHIGLYRIGNFTDSYVTLYNGYSDNSQELPIYDCYLIVYPNYSFNNFVVYPQVFDLTKMFGAGDEPSVQQFNQWYSNEYYDYTLSSKQLLKGYSIQTYNDTDIMSQFTYQLYNSVDKYFNMGNVFGMSNVYDWFNLNIFGGNASISIYIVWNIVLYEFVMDLLFLLYALFMWFIDVTKRLIEKPLDSIK